MKVAVVGSRGLNVLDLEAYLPENVTEIVSGGAKGIDSCVKNYCMEKKIPYKEFLPDYRRYRGGATFQRNREILAYCDMVVALWDGHSNGTHYMIEECRKCGIPLVLHTLTVP